MFTDIELEQCILASMQNDEEFLALGVQRLSKDDFTTDQTRTVFALLKEAFLKGGKISSKTDLPIAQRALWAELISWGLEFTLEPFLRRLNQLEELSAKRALQKAAQEALAALQNGARLDEASSKLDLAKSQSAKTALLDTKLSCKATLKEWDVVQNAGLKGLDSGFSQLNAMSGGFKTGELFILAARPGMGKSAMMSDFVLKALEQDAGVLVFSLEMGAPQVMMRLLAAKTKIALKSCMNADFSARDWELVSSQISKLVKAPLYVCDDAQLSLAGLKATARLAKSKAPLKLICLDYLQLINSTTNVPRHEFVAQVTRTLKTLARELDVCIVALSQLNREMERRQDARPMLSDLRESGSIEQDADTVCFIHREELLKQKKAKAAGKGYISSLEERAELIVAKNRHGGTGVIKVDFLRKCAHFKSAVISAQPEYQAFSED